MFIRPAVGRVAVLLAAGCGSSSRGAAGGNGQGGAGGAGFNPGALTVDTCQGPRAYVGVSFAYHEQVTTNYQRLTDADWLSDLSASTPPEDVPWMAPVIAN